MNFLSRNKLDPGTTRFSPAFQSAQWASQQSSNTSSSLSDFTDESTEPDDESVKRSEKEEILFDAEKNMKKELGFN